MAEERISVIVYEKDPCENCTGNPMTDCQICERDLRYDGGMTRQEAIEKMAKALEEKSEQMARECLNSNPYNNPLGAEDLAEAALNALLEK